MGEQDNAFVESNFDWSGLFFLSSGDSGPLLITMKGQNATINSIRVGGASL